MCGLNSVIRQYHRWGKSLTTKWHTNLHTLLHFPRLHHVMSAVFKDQAGSQKLPISQSIQSSSFEDCPRGKHIQLS